MIAARPDRPGAPADAGRSAVPRRISSLAWIAFALVAAAAVFALFRRFVPLNMDEFVSYQTIVALHFPNSAENVFCSTNASFYLKVLDRITLPLLTYDYIGSLSALLYTPLYLAWPSPDSARLEGIIALFLQALVLARLFRFRAAPVFCCLLFFVPYSFVHLADTGPVAFQTTSVFVVCYLLRAWLLSRNPRRRAGLLLGAGLTIGLGCWVKPTYFFVSAGLATLAISTLAIALVRRPAERIRRLAEYGLLFFSAALSATLVYEAKHPNGGAYLPVITGNFVPGQVQFAGLATRLQENVLHFLYRPLDATLSCFDFVPPLPVAEVLIWLATGALVAGSLRSRGGRPRHRREIWLNWTLCAVALLLVATNLYAKSMHHAVLAYPFAILAVARAVQTSVGPSVRIAVAVFVVLHGVLFLRFPVMYEQARRNGDGKAYVTELNAELNRTEADGAVIACVDWGIYFVKALYGPRSQVVLFLCRTDDDTQLDRAAAIARRLHRNLAVVGLADNQPVRERLRTGFPHVAERPAGAGNNPWRIWRVSAADLAGQR
jgi:hypothetical protein